MRKDKAGKRESHSKLDAEVVLVTPELATEWLEHNTHNRDIVQIKVDELARDMLAGKWMLTHQGIAFDESGTLIDGQHRLWAIFQSKKTVPLVVTRGLKLGAQLVIDAHYGRHASDFLSLTDKHGKVAPIEISILLQLLRGAAVHYTRLTHTEVEREYTRHKDAVAFAMSCFPTTRTRITTGAVLGQVARAYYSEFNKDEIRKFCAVLLTGVSNGAKNDKMPLLLRDNLITGDGNRSLIAHRAHIKTGIALRSYLEGRILARLMVRGATDSFKIPFETRERTSLSKTDTTKHVGRVWAALRRRKSATSTEIADALNLTINVAGQVLRKIESVGWATSTGTVNKVYKAKKDEKMQKSKL